MHLLYHFFILLYSFAIRLAAPFNPKAKQWVTGRQAWRTTFRQGLGKVTQTPTLWVHVSSLGEFEQGRPIIEQFRLAYPDWRIVLTFFSPSGYEVRKDYPLAEFVGYLPTDTPQNVRDFLDLVQPTAAVFVKYDFWANYLLQLKRRKIPTILVSALFRPSQPFFRWYGPLWRTMLGCFSHIFVQNKASAGLLQGVGFHNVTIAGDTRVDRVLRIATEVKPNPTIAAFVGESPVLIIGSSWEADEQLLLPLLQTVEFQYFKIIIAPHEPSERNVTRICQQFGKAQRYSLYKAEDAGKNNLLVIDNVGMLNSLYRFGTIAYIGGGWGKGIHNTLEPAALGLPLIFGPNYKKFEEARQFVALGGAFPVHNDHELRQILLQLQEPAFYEKTSKAVSGYLESNKGATTMVMAWLKSNVSI